MSEEFDFERIKNKTIEQLKAGKPLGEGGAFAPLLESILNAALEGEIDAHLSDEECMSGNRCNGKMQKQVQTSMGEVTVFAPLGAGRYRPMSLRIKQRLTQLILRPPPHKFNQKLNIFSSWP